MKIIHLYIFILYLYVFQGAGINALHNTNNTMDNDGQ